VATIPHVGSSPLWGFTPPCGWHKTLKDWDRPHTVYVVATIGCDRPVKIGMTNWLDQRLWSLSSGNPDGVYAAGSEPVCKWLARQVEARLHLHFADRSRGREWFDVPAIEAVAALSELSARARDATVAIARMVPKAKADARRFARR